MLGDTSQVDMQHCVPGSEVPVGYRTSDLLYYMLAEAEGVEKEADESKSVLGKFC